MIQRFIFLLVCSYSMSFFAADQFKLLLNNVALSVDKQAIDDSCKALEEHVQSLPAHEQQQVLESSKPDIATFVNDQLQNDRMRTIACGGFAAGAVYVGYKSLVAGEYATFAKLCIATCGLSWVAKRDYQSSKERKRRFTQFLQRFNITVKKS